MSFLCILLGLCSHDHVGWPLHKRQRCLDCGRSRAYVLGREKQGRWERDWEERKEQEVFVLRGEGSDG
jgi:hypothetical protein